MKPFDIYISSSQNVYENIALEEFLLTNSKQDILLFYINKDSVVIGKHQNPWIEVDLSPFRKFKIIRRLSGGGTVFHDLGNINFSFLRNKETDFVNFKEHIVPISQSLEQLHIPNSISERNDLFVGEYKVSGNAEHVNSSLKRLLHHGTLLYDSNLVKLNGSIKPKEKLKIKTHAVSSKRSPVSNLRDFYDWGNTESFLQLIIQKLKTIIDVKSVQEIDPSNIKEVKNLIEDKYILDDWNFNHTPQFFYTGKSGEKYKIRKGKVIESKDFQNIGLPFKSILEHD
ncbi:MAG: lipoate--protein ligase family protein [Bacteroidetes bacterium]|nr:lipoate--protein ligase family protein [Bacteroidota bacterium]